MRQCPVCDKKTESLQCPNCGFDASRDYEHFPSLVPFMSIEARRKAWQERQKLENQAQAQNTAASAPAQTETKTQDVGIIWLLIGKYLKLLEPIAAFTEKLEHRGEHAKGIARCRDFLLYAFLFGFLNVAVFGPVLLIGYALLSVGHSALHHCPMWSPEPCVVRSSCDSYFCAPEKHHEWDDPGCLDVQTCTICGVQRGGTNSHVWETTDPQDSQQCILCGAHRGEASFLYVSNVDGSVLAHKLDSDTPSHSLQFTDSADLPEGGVFATDFLGQAVPIDTTMSGDTLTVTFSQDLAPGSYHVFDQNNETRLVTLHYCRENSPFPYTTRAESAPFRAENLLTGQHLIFNGEKYATTSDDDAQLFQALFADRHDAYYCLTSDSQWITFYTIVKDNRFLAATSNGTVYWSGELTDECYWLIDETQE